MHDLTRRHIEYRNRMESKSININNIGKSTANSQIKIQK